MKRSFCEFPCPACSEGVLPADDGTGADVDANLYEQYDCTMRKSDMILEMLESGQTASDCALDFQKMHVFPSTLRELQGVAQLICRKNSDKSGIFCHQYASFCVKIGHCFPKISDTETGSGIPESGPEAVTNVKLIGGLQPDTFVKSLLASCWQEIEASLNRYPPAMFSPFERSAAPEKLPTHMQRAVSAAKLIGELFCMGFFHPISSQIVICDIVKELMEKDNDIAFVCACAVIHGVWMRLDKAAKASMNPYLDKLAEVQAQRPDRHHLPESYPKIVDRRSECDIDLDMCLFELDCEMTLPSSAVSCWQHASPHKKRAIIAALLPDFLSADSDSDSDSEEDDPRVLLAILMGTREKVVAPEAEDPNGGLAVIYALLDQLDPAELREIAVHIVRAFSFEHPYTGPHAALLVVGKKSIELLADIIDKMQGPIFGLGVDVLASCLHAVRSIQKAVEDLSPPLMRPPKKKKTWFPMPEPEPDFETPRIPKIQPSEPAYEQCIGAIRTLVACGVQNPEEEMEFARSFSRMLVGYLQSLQSMCETHDYNLGASRFPSRLLCWCEYHDFMLDYRHALAQRKQQDLQLPTDVHFGTRLTSASTWYAVRPGVIAYSKDMHCAALYINGFELDTLGVSLKGADQAVKRAAKNLFCMFRLAETFVRLQGENDDFGSTRERKFKAVCRSVRTKEMILARTSFNVPWVDIQVGVRLLAARKIWAFFKDVKERRTHSWLAPCRQAAATEQTEFATGVFLTKEVSEILDVGSQGGDGASRGESEHSSETWSICPGHVEARDRPLGPWCLLLSSSALADLRNLWGRNRSSLDACLNKLRGIESGIWNGNVAQQLKISHSSVPIYEAKVLNNIRILWQVDAGFCQVSRCEGQVIRVWTILSDHKEVKALAPKLAAFNSARSAEVLRVCKVRYRPEPSNRWYILPEQCAHQLPEAQAVAGVDDYELEDEIGSDSEGEEAAVESAVPEASNDVDYATKHRKLFLFSERMVEELLEGRMHHAQHNVSAKEASIIHSSHNSMVIGRSGTGKTTCVIYRLLSLYLSFIKGGREVSHFRQVFITKNLELCFRVKRHFDVLVKAYKAPGEEDAQDNSEDLDLFVDVDIENRFRDAPESFADLDDSCFPLFLTFEKVLKMIESACRSKARERRQKAKDARGCPEEEEGLNITASFLETGRTRASTGQRTKSDEENLAGSSEVEILGREVDFEAFSSKYWHRLHENLRSHFDPSLVWAEIQSIIKGHEIALNKPQGVLSLEEYEGLTVKHAFFLHHRKRLYDLFLNYETVKKKRGDYDQMDRVHKVRSMISGFQDGTDLGLNSLDELYVDECQDLPPGLLQLLLGLVKQPDGFVMFCGDSAQTISKGSSFRFDDLSSMFYRNMERSQPNAPQERKMLRKEQLTRNFRSHNGILRLASSVIDLIEAYFPESIDKMERDRSDEEGTKPIVVTGDAQKGWTLLFQQQGTSSVEFGAHHAIIVRTEKAKDKVRRMSNRPGFFGTVYDAKGLEFSEVVLFNFFSDSPAKKEWRVVLESLRKKGVPTAQPPALDRAKHNILVLELKELYTAVTRPMHKLWIVDEMVENLDSDLHPIFEYWRWGGCAPDSKEPLVSFVDQAEVLRLFSVQGNRSTPEEWAKNGHYLFQHRHYEHALHCFVQAGDEYVSEQNFANACLLRSDAARMSRVGKPEPDVLAKYEEAGGLFEEIGQAVSAADCFSSAKQHSKAGDLYRRAAQQVTTADERKKQLKLFESSAREFISARQFTLASCMFEEGCLYREALGALEKGQLIAEAVVFVSKHYGEISKDQRQRVAEKGFLHHHERKEETCVKRALALLESDDEREALLKKHRDKCGFRRLVDWYHGSSPPRHHDAADVLREEWEWKEALHSYLECNTMEAGSLAHQCCVRLLAQHARRQGSSKATSLVELQSGLTTGEATELLEKVISCPSPPEVQQKSLVFMHLLANNADGLYQCFTFFNALSHEMARGVSLTQAFAEAVAWELRCLDMLFACPVKCLTPRVWSEVGLRHVELCELMFPRPLTENPATSNFRKMAREVYFSCLPSHEKERAIRQVCCDLWGDVLLGQEALPVLKKPDVRLERHEVQGEKTRVAKIQLAALKRAMRRNLLNNAFRSLLDSKRTKSFAQGVHNMMPCFSLAYYGVCEKTAVGQTCHGSHAGAPAEEFDAALGVVITRCCEVQKLLELYGACAYRPPRKKEGGASSEKVQEERKTAEEDRPCTNLAEALGYERCHWFEMLLREGLQHVDVRILRKGAVADDVRRIPLHLKIGLVEFVLQFWLAAPRLKPRPKPKQDSDKPVLPKWSFADTGSVLRVVLLLFKLEIPDRCIPMAFSGKISPFKAEVPMSQGFLEAAWYSVDVLKSGQVDRLRLKQVAEFVLVIVKHIDDAFAHPIDLIELLECAVAVALGCMKACHNVVTPKSYLSFIVGRQSLIHAMMHSHTANTEASAALEILHNACLKLLEDMVSGRAFRGFHRQDAKRVFLEVPTWKQYESMATRLAILVVWMGYNVDPSPEGLSKVYRSIEAMSGLKVLKDGLRSWPDHRAKKAWLGFSEDQMLATVQGFVCAGSNEIVRWSRAPGTGFHPLEPLPETGIDGAPWSDILFISSRAVREDCSIICGAHAAAYLAQQQALCSKREQAHILKDDENDAVTDSQASEETARLENTASRTIQMWFFSLRAARLAKLQGSVIEDTEDLIFEREDSAFEDV